MIGRVIAVISGLFLLAAAVSAAQAEPRIALVLGNSNYGKEIGKLPNPVNDAGLIANALQQTGFTVIKVTDADQKQMKRAIKDFGEKLAAAGPTATGLFFYAGHGVQVGGINYLVPLGADINKEADVDIESISADTVLQQMEFAGSKVNIVILDACRNNPMARGFRSTSRGLAPMDSVRGTFIAYSTAPGSVAADGSGSNSPYASALAKTIVQPGVGIEEAFRDVRAQVIAATEEKQIPWDSSSLTAPFIFKQGTAAPAAAAQPAPAAAPAASNLAAEKAVWEAISDSKQPGDYQAYLDQYPQGAYAGLARSRMASLGGDKARIQPAAPKVAPAAVQTPAPQPAPAAVPAQAPAPVEASNQPAEDSGGFFGLGSSSSSGKKVELDSRGVDCRINDALRPATDCKNTKKPRPKTRP